LREENLVEQLSAILDQIDLHKTGVRHNRFNQAVLGIKNPSGKYSDIDLKTYVQYILKSGSNEEKRELMGCFKSRIKVTQKVVTIG